MSNRETEIKEALAAAENAMVYIDDALSELKGAKTLSTIDTFFGGTFTSLLKRNKMGKGNQKIGLANQAIEKLNEELKDINVGGIAMADDSLTTNFFDVAFDNIFTDLKVGGEIASIISRLETTKEEVQVIIDTLKKQV